MARKADKKPPSAMEQSLRVEIHKQLDDLAAASKPWVPAWITNAILAAHARGKGKGDDAKFWEHCTYAYVRHEVGQIINDRAGDKYTPEDSRQMKLPGYPAAQGYYTVDRVVTDGKPPEPIAVPTALCTDDELTGKVALHRGLSAAHSAHADDLERYIADRRSRFAAE